MVGCQFVHKGPFLPDILSRGILTISKIFVNTFLASTAIVFHNKKSELLLFYILSYLKLYVFVPFTFCTILTVTPSSSRSGSTSQKLHVVRRRIEDVVLLRQAYAGSFELELQEPCVGPPERGHQIQICRSFAPNDPANAGGALTCALHPRAILAQSSQC